MKINQTKFIVTSFAILFIVFCLVLLVSINKVYDQKENRNHMKRLLTNQLFNPSVQAVELATMMPDNKVKASILASTTSITSATVQRDTAMQTKHQTIPILMYHHIRDFNDPTDTIGTNLSVDPVAFAAQLDYIRELGYSTITFAELESGNLPDKPVILSFDDGYENFYQNAYPALKSRGMKSVNFIITGSLAGDYMTEAQIKELSDNGFEIGAHTVSHPDLSTATTARAIKEITASKSALETIIGKKVISFCYPSGKYNPEVEKEVKDAGYLYATTTKGGLADITANSLELSRYRVNHDTNIKGFFK